MITAFLSHSSVDKKRYVEFVAQKLGGAYCVYDAYTFEEGMQPIEEILKGLDTSQIFVVFLSEAALDSEWVRFELLQAHTRLQEGLLERIFPIIIDRTILHSDPRIPQWMKDQYNLKYVSRPVVAARRIRQRQKEISWRRHPKLAARDGLFVGRNELIKVLEERFDDFGRSLPNCIIASGLPRVGRSKLLRNTLVKGNIVSPSYEYPTIVMHREDSIEDLLLKLYDLGFSDRQYPSGLMELSVEERVEIAIAIVRDIQDVKETVLIHDEGCLVRYDRTIQPWFDRICRETSGSKITFLLASRYRPSPENIRNADYVYAIEVPELSFPERSGMLKRLLELEGVALSLEEFSHFANLQFGLPDQVTFTCDLIKDKGPQEARRFSNQITEYNSDKASVILAKYSGQQEKLDFLFMLSEFEFISFSFLYSLVEEDVYQPLVDELIASAVCDYVGVEKEFIRLNDVIRDYVRRGRIEIPPSLKEKLKLHLESFLAEPATEDRDISDVTYSIRQAIKLGKTAPEQYLIPSHFLNSMKELYQERGHLDRVIELADKLLEKPHLLEVTVAADIRYYLCLSLARKRNRRLLTEVQAINGPEHDFLLGFYYRLMGRAEEAIDRLSRCLRDRVVSARAKRELVQVYLSIEDFDSAASLARANYEEYRNNAFHVQAYFESLVNARKPGEHRELLLRLISELEGIGSEMADQMALIARAEFAAKCDCDYQEALRYLFSATSRFPNSHYPLLAKAYLAARQGDLGTLMIAYDALERMSIDRTFSENSLVRLKAYLLCLSDDLSSAISYAESNLRGCPAKSKDAFVQKLRETATSHGKCP